MYPGTTSIDGGNNWLNALKTLENVEISMKKEQIQNLLSMAEDTGLTWIASQSTVLRTLTQGA